MSYEQDTRYWARCDSCGARPPYTSPTRDGARVHALARGWTETEAETAVLKARYVRLECPACTAHRKPVCGPEGDAEGRAPDPDPVVDGVWRCPCGHNLDGDPTVPKADYDCQHAGCTCPQCRPPELGVA